jgi:hypothetical protein
MEDGRIPKQKFLLMGNFIIQGKWVKQEQDGRTSSGGTRHRSWEYENGGDKQKTEKNGCVI